MSHIQPDYDEANLRRIVEEGGGDYRGVMKGFGSIPGIVTFNDAESVTETTMALTVTGLTVENVREKIREEQGKMGTETREENTMDTSSDFEKALRETADDLSTSEATILLWDAWSPEQRDQFATAYANGDWDTVDVLAPLEGRSQYWRQIVLHNLYDLASAWKTSQTYRGKRGKSHIR